MKFYEALKEVLENGKRIRRPHWDKGLSIGRGCPYLQEYRNRVPVGTSPQFFTNGDLIAADWEVVREKIKKTRTVWINCYKNASSDGRVHATPEDAAVFHRNPDFLFTKEVTFEWEEGAE